ncbi:MAG: NAD(P)-binding protein [Deltaproteobacteria bacterium]|nr:NAD(P)-binding protein [Deltaproteobacteria bacterium]
MAKLRVAILGGGAAGVGLLWALAMAKRDRLTADDYDITLIHDGDTVGGHSMSWPETINGRTCQLDLGVQVIAPAMYPTVSTMLAHDDFAGVHLDPVDLRIACAFPDTAGGAPYWGNFPAYQDTALYRQGQADAATFEGLIDKAKHDPLAWALTLRNFLDANRGRFTDLDFFEQYFLNPYMSIMNGYGSALLEQVIVGDVIPIFGWGLGAFTHPTQGFARFRDGAGFWVQTMADIAQRQLGDALTLLLGASVAGFAPGAAPTVSIQGEPSPRRFDLVVSTLDMFTTAKLLYEKPGWDHLGPYVGDPTEFGTTVWPLQPGFCYLHQDASILAAGLPSPLQETLQFTAPPTPAGQRYDLTYSYTTYIESNLLGIGNPDRQFYLTMYGFDPTKPSPVPVPVPKVGIQTSMNWVHGMWLPSFMAEQKLRFHAAQGVSRYAAPLPSQRPTNLFFAGNNLTMDSEEGALLSGLAVAKYAFGFNPMMSLLPKLDWKDTKQYGEALLLFEAMYELMFAPSWAMPGTRPGSAAPAAFRPLAHVLAMRAG